MTMQMKDNGQTAYESRLRDAWKRECVDENDTNCVVPDGGKVIAPMTMMDSCQCAVSEGSPAVQDGGQAEANRRQLAAAKDHANGVQKWADYFAGQRDGREHLDSVNDGGQSDYEARLASAWKNPETIGG